MQKPFPDTGNIATASPEQQFIGGDDDKGELANIEIYWVHDSISTTEVAEFKFSLAVYVSSLTVNMSNFFWVCRESLFFFAYSDYFFFPATFKHFNPDACLTKCVKEKLHCRYFKFSISKEEKMYKIIEWHAVLKRAKWKI